MKVLLSWIREFVDVPESAEEIGKLMSVRGLALEGLEVVPGNPEGLPPQGDVVMDFDVTANRPDCLSMIGIAREIATAYGRPLRSEGDGFSRRQAQRRLKPSLSERLRTRFPSPSRMPSCARATPARSPT